MRHKELSTDKAKMMDVITHVSRCLRNKGEKFDIVMLLQPTSPLRTAQDIDRSIRMLFRKPSRAVVSASEAERHPLWSNALGRRGLIRNFIRPNVKGRSRQQLLKYYRLNGAICAAFYDYLQENRGFFEKRTLAYRMPQERLADIDSLLDFWLAEAIIERRKNTQ